MSSEHADGITSGFPGRPRRTSRGLAAIMAGTLAGQGLSLAAAPLLSRLYSPSEFGTFAVLSAIAMTFGAVVTLRFDAAVPLPDSEDSARALVGLSLLTTVAWTVLLFATYPWWSGPIIRLLNDDQVGSLLLVIPLVAASFGLFRTLNQWALRQGRYAATARRNAVQAAATVGIQVTAGAFGASSGGLLGGLGCGQAIGAASMLPGSGLRGNVRRAAMASAAARFRRFPLLLTPSALANTAGLYAPLLFVAAFYGPIAAGLLGFAQRILAVPVTLVGQAAAQVYLSELARSRREVGGREDAYFRTATKRLCLASAPGTLILLLAGPALFGFLFGAQWVESGELAQALAISLGAQLVASPLSQTLVVFERVRLQLAWDLMRLGLTCGAVVIAHELGTGLNTAVWALSIATAAAYIMSWLLSWKTLKSHARDSQPPTSQ